MTHTVEVNNDTCIGCTICTRICPTGTLQMDNKTKKAYTTDILCDNAWGCLFVCPTQAISIVEVQG